MGIYVPAKTDIYVGLILKCMLRPKIELSRQ